MKISIRTKFTLGMVFFFVVIAFISFLSAYHLNNLSKKTDAILKENHLSVVYARDMSEGLTNINQKITNSFLANRLPDSILINKSLTSFDKSLHLEINNITEVGEDKLASSIESGFNEYRDSLATLLKMSKLPDKIVYLRTKFSTLYPQLILLSQMNEKAIELKTNDAKVSAKNALTQMTILGTLCFLITLSFTYSFASYFNERFYQLYNGIKEIVASNYGQRLYFDGEDEFYDISLVFNEMAEKLNETRQNASLTFKEDFEREISQNQVQELQRILEQMKSIEKQAVELIAKFENNK